MIVTDPLPRISRCCPRVPEFVKQNLINYCDAGYFYCHSGDTKKICLFDSLGSDFSEQVPIHEQNMEWSPVSKHYIQPGCGDKEG